MNRNDQHRQDSASQERAQNTEKAAWERPQLVRMGHLKEFVQGGGKSGSQFDMDVNGGGKGGLG
jgi:hypothetical protein